MKYGYQEIENAVIIKGKLYKVVFDNYLTCIDCNLFKRDKSCCNFCSAFETINKNVIFKRISGNLLLKLKENEEG